jgi:hypothetical protein
MLRLLVAAVCAGSLLGGCAAHAPRGSRATLGYTDRKFFAVMHYDAVSARTPTPGGHAYAGRIAGRACGVDINYNAEYKGGSLMLDGFVKSLDRATAAVPLNVYSGFQPDKPSRIVVRDSKTSAGLVRTIEGSIGGADAPEFSGFEDGRNAIIAAAATAGPRHHEIELRLAYDTISGKAGFREFDLHAQGDFYEGTMTFSGHKLPFRVRGRGALWSMPAADQAAILPFVITCVQDERRLVQEVDLGYQQ